MRSAQSELGILFIAKLVIHAEVIERPLAWRPNVAVQIRSAELGQLAEELGVVAGALRVGGGKGAQPLAALRKLRLAAEEEADARAGELWPLCARLKLEQLVSHRQL
eukprot:CAMPEP_0179955870 /NCGR_PEP_ID=MMETSP0983-20121128/26537_1 /TAXON_ID=483367 /ORGANISM="non described non described, Strain CCMP 2436" /LENGTH=106 /DNA_ID=CAMNT_0021867581 /DNA_START=19 /DNA_END=336 /DNA_ORIENTATION=-